MIHSAASALRFLLNLLRRVKPTRVVWSAARGHSKCAVYLLSAFSLLPPAQGGSLAPSGTSASPRPSIAIIIDDMGNSYPRGEQAIRLPGSVTFAFLPHTPHAVELANLANRLNKDVMLHLPLEAMNRQALGPGGVTLEMNYTDFHRTFIDDLNAIPHAIGVNNHMGSLLTQHPGHMDWLMRAISEQGSLFFVDSFTTPNSVATQFANEHWVPNVQRDVFLDHERNLVRINAQFNRLIEIAQRKGIALAIGHPYPETLLVLKTRLPALNTLGVKLVSISELLRIHLKRADTWRAFLSP